MNHYNIGDCLVCKTSVIEIVGKFSEKVYRVVKYGKGFLSFHVKGYDVYKLNKYFKKCDSGVIYKADKLLQMHLSIVKNIVKASKATRKAKGFVSMNSYGYSLKLRIKKGQWKKHINVNYATPSIVNTWSWEYSHSTPIYTKEYEIINKYFLTLKESLTELWQNIKILSE